eukprot:15446378-Alexandrium_andersonii.AAC.1
MEALPHAPSHALALALARGHEQAPAMPSPVIAHFFFFSHPLRGTAPRGLMQKVDDERAQGRQPACVCIRGCPRLK